MMRNNIKSNSWFICHKPNSTARLRLFCFPYAGGGPSSFYTWANELPSDVEIIGIQMPGVETRFMEPPITSLPILVETLAHAIRPEVNQPFAFFGHSLGAFIGFELTRKLSRQLGFNPVHLFVSSIRAPHIPDPSPPIHHLPEHGFLEKLRRRYSGTQDEILGDPDMIKELLPGLRAYIKMYESYNYINEDTLDCPITVFGGLEDDTVSRENLEAWRRQTKGSFALHMISGNHFFILFERQQFLPILTEEINKTLKTLQ